MVLIASGVTYITYRRSIQQLVRKEYSTLAIEAATSLGNSLESYAAILDDLAQEEDLRSENFQAQRLALERWGNRLYPFDAGVAVVNDKGIISWSQPLRFDWIGRDLHDTAFFQSVKGGKSFVCSDLIQTESLLGQDLILIGVPFLDQDGDFAGMLGGVFHMHYPQLSPIYAEMTQIGSNDGGYAYLVDAMGRTIYHPVASQVGLDASQLPIVRRALAGQAGSTVIIGPADEDMVVGYAPVPEAGWALIVQQNWKEAMAPIRRFALTLLGALLTSLLVPAVLVYIGIDRITRPLGELAMGAERIAQGDFTHTVNVHTNDELHRLGQQFNVMARKLQASYATLEDKVEERTAELATLNTIAARMSQSLDLGVILEDVITETVKGVSAQAGAIYLVDPDTDTLYLATQIGFGKDAAQSARQLDFAHERAQSTYQHGELWLQNNVWQKSNNGSNPRQLGFGSIACVPLLAKARLLGVMFLAAPLYREFTVQDGHLFTSIGQQVGMGIDNARLFTEEQQRRREAMALADIADLVSGNLDIQEILQLAVRRVSDILETDRCIVFEAQANESPQFVPAACCQTQGESLATSWERLEEARLDLAAIWPFSEVIASKAPIAINNVTQDARVSAKLKEILGCTSMLISPILVREKMLGILYLDTLPPNQRQFARRQQELTLALCNEIAVALENAKLFQDLERRNQELATLNAVATIVNESLALEVTLSAALSTTLKMIDVQAGEIRLWDAKRKRLVVRAHQGLRHPSSEQGITLDAKRREVLRSGQVLVVDDPEILQSPELLAENLLSLAIVPLRSKDQTLGIMTVGSRETDHHFTKADSELLQAIGTQLGLAGENARLFEEERIRAHQLGIINEIGQRIAAILSLNELLPFVARTLQATFDYYGVNILLLDSEQEHLILRACAGGYAECLSVGTRVSIDAGINGQVVRGNAPALVSDLSQEPLYQNLGLAPSAHAGIVLPISVGGRLLGVLEVQHATSEPFGEIELDHLSTLVDQIAVAIENARLYEQSRDLAIVEERTRLARELHDSVTQSLFSIVLNAEAANTLLPTEPDRSSEAIQRLQEIAQDALAEMRSLIHELRPPSLGEQDFESALERYINVIRKRYSLDVRLKIRGELGLSREFEQALYRIVQEALNNVVKHAEADRAEIELVLQEQGVWLLIEDNGVGFDSSQAPQQERHFGLDSMRERAESLGGLFEIESAPQKGTRIRVDIPLPDNA
jgi:nitrate/nitrite-specific signal transduction histidine kinase